MKTNLGFPELNGKVAVAASHYWCNWGSALFLVGDLLEPEELPESSRRPDITLAPAARELFCNF